MPRRGLEPCVAAAEAAEAEAAKHRPSAQAKEARMAELEERARLFGAGSEAFALSRSLLQCLCACVV